MNEKREMWHARITRQPKHQQLIVDWFRRSGTSQRVSPIDAPQYVRDYFTCDADGKMDVDITLEELRASPKSKITDRERFHAFNNGIGPNHVVGYVKIKVPDPVYDWDREYTLSTHKLRILNRVKAELDSVVEFKNDYSTPDDFFADCPEGKFRWDGGEMFDPGDLIPVWCDSCDTWHGHHYYTIMGRRANGQRYVELMDCDNSDDHDCIASWQDGDDEIQWQEVQDSLDTDANWIQRAQYDLWCAETGEDPLDFTWRVFKNKHEWFRFWINSARDNIRFLLMNNCNQVVAHYKGCDITIFIEFVDGNPQYSFQFALTRPDEELSPCVSDTYDAKNEYDALTTAFKLINKYRWN